MIELLGVSKFFGNAVAVDNLQLTIAEGEFCVLVGTSGCGKSTTLRLINKLLPHDRGMIRIQGEEINSFNVQQLRRRIGYAIQHTGLFPHWSVARNIGTVPQLLGWPTDRIEARVRELMQLLGMPWAEYAGKYPSQLSGGQAQRVGVARALAGDPATLLMDEPFGALDPITRDSLQNELLRIQGQLHKTIVFVTHDMDEALKLADRIVVMDQGKIVQVESPTNLLRQPATRYVESLLGTNERGLKLAALEQLGTIMQPLSTDLPATDSARVLATTDNARLALSQMLWTGEHTVLVANGQGRPVGQVGLDQLIRSRSS